MPESRNHATETWSFDGKHKLRIVSSLIDESLRFRFLADTHLALADDRDAVFSNNYKRMAQWGAKKNVFEASLPHPNECDLLLLGGDIISFPTLANVEYLQARLNACGVSYAYIAGNHDWHFEGDSGSDFEQRDRWIARRLKTLYTGRNPLGYAVCIKGCKIILIDNSLYHITPEQLEFYRSEIKDGMPTFLVMHIPFWHEGWGVCTCGCPQWGAAHDPYWQIERRERWAECLMPSTFAFREAVFNTPSLLGILAGHTHCYMASTEKGCPQWVVASNHGGAYFDILVESAALHIDEIGNDVRRSAMPRPDVCARRW